MTRTFHLGEPSKHQKVCFTRVLQVGHLNPFLQQHSLWPQQQAGIFSKRKMPWTLHALHSASLCRLSLVFCGLVISTWLGRKAEVVSWVYTDISSHPMMS